MICVKNLLALISGVLMIVFRKCFANFITWSWGVNKSRAAVVLKIYASVHENAKCWGQSTGNCSSMMGKKLATQRYGANAKAKKLSGEIIASEGCGRGRKWRIHWDDVKIGESVHSSKVLENAGSVEEIKDDVVMAEHDSDEELLAEELAEAEPEMEKGGEPSSIDPLVIKWTIVDNRCR